MIFGILRIEYDSLTVFSLLSPQGGLFFLGPFRGGGGLIGEGDLFERGAYLFLEKII